MIDFWQGVGFLGDLRGGFQPLKALRTTEATENMRIFAQCPQWSSVLFSGLLTPAAAELSARFLATGALPPAATAADH
jgi:hypothetical protein